MYEKTKKKAKSDNNNNKSRLNSLASNNEFAYLQSIEKEVIEKGDD